MRSLTKRPRSPDGSYSRPLGTAKSSGKHSSNRLSRYVEIHRTVMERYLRSSFVQDDDLSFEPAPGGLLLDGTIHCSGGIYIEVRKVVRRLTDDEDPLVVRGTYTYNVTLAGEGNIFRYDGPHPEHRQTHHVHRFDVLAGDTEGTVEPIHDEDDTPTLGEVIEEAQTWYYDHYDALM